MDDELLCQLRDALVGTSGWTGAELAADVREILSGMNLLVLPGPQPMSTAPKDGTRILALTAWEAVDNTFDDALSVPAGGHWVAANWDASYDGEGSFVFADDREGWCHGIEPVCWMPMPPIPDEQTMRRLSKGVTAEMLANDRRPNGAPMWASDGTILGDRGKRSIFDDVDE